MFQTKMGAVTKLFNKSCKDAENQDTCRKCKEAAKKAKRKCEACKDKYRKCEARYGADGNKLDKCEEKAAVNCGHRIFLKCKKEYRDAADGCVMGKEFTAPAKYRDETPASRAFARLTDIGLVRQVKQRMATRKLVKKLKESKSKCQCCGQELPPLQSAGTRFKRRRGTRRRRRKSRRQRRTKQRKRRRRRRRTRRR